MRVPPDAGPLVIAPCPAWFKDAYWGKHLECELERSEEYKLANWMCALRHERESPEAERARYERDDKMAEELASQRRRRRPRN